MRVQLSEKSKAEFIELITKDSITCWFEGDEFVMPSGQGKTAKGIVLAKLLVWQHRQNEVDELKLQVAEMKSRLNDAYTDGQSAMYAARQTKVDELQKRVDAVKGLIEDLNKCYQQDHQNKFEYWRGFADSAGILGKRLEQALKGGSND
ncbi:hypothetical protein QLH32_04735 [Acinetobacter corruptisaponis]|uniref:Uncharacterized protein n=1 Tax=Acinetobacter corruptisaponis TaxID=3045147 RepID=A0ABY8S5X0_9GAMM|nr:hypothetical protein [Acinetobacter sp. KCTC 92772]WHP06781.1 hypothetical protein QLH32_04735 [Acinetobacter sp. KCTC 92772]